MQASHESPIEAFHTLSHSKGGINHPSKCRLHFFQTRKVSSWSSCSSSIWTGKADKIHNNPDSALVLILSSRLNVRLNPSPGRLFSDHTASNITELQFMRLHSGELHFICFISCFKKFTVISSQGDRTLAQPHLQTNITLLTKLWSSTTKKGQIVLQNIKANHQ